MEIQQLGVRCFIYHPQSLCYHKKSLFNHPVCGTHIRVPHRIIQHPPRNKKLCKRCARMDFPQIQFPVQTEDLLILAVALSSNINEESI